MKKIFLVLLSVVLFVPTLQAQTFSDVATKHWAYSYIEDMVDKGIIDEGYFFHPTRKLTRAELVKIMVIATTGIIDDQMPEEQTFPDVNPEDWFYLYVETAKLTGLIDGYPDGFFLRIRNGS